MVSLILTSTTADTVSRVLYHYDTAALLRNCREAYALALKNKLDETTCVCGTNNPTVKRRLRFCCELVRYLDQLQARLYSWAPSLTQSQPVH